jgi:hypothetical protein
LLLLLYGQVPEILSYHVFHLELDGFAELFFETSFYLLRIPSLNLSDAQFFIDELDHTLHDLSEGENSEMLLVEMSFAAEALLDHSENGWHVGSIIPTELNDVVKLKYETLDFQEFDLRQVSLSLMALTWVDLSIQRGLMGCLAAT